MSSEGLVSAALKGDPPTRVAVAMSGGVDSSVTAALLKEQGHEVIGLTLQLYDHGAMGGATGKTCCAGRDIHDARTVAEHLGIAHYVINRQERFRQQVMEPFAESYLAGETPIPCVLCNQTVKFQDLVEIARELGAAALATGHYVRRVVGPSGKAELHRAADLTRDQSYFLFATTQDQLDYLRFPLGEMENKAETRAHAARLGLRIAAKPDSQDICFVPDGDYAAVVARLRPHLSRPGDIVNEEGHILGHHEGIIHYTVGQRKGLGVGGAGAPLYVLKLDPEHNQVIVGPRESLGQTTVALSGVNWLGEDTTGDGGESPQLHVKLRSTQPPVDARLDRGASRLTLYTPQAGVAPGQAAVFYRGNRVLGGGWIRKGA